MTKSKQENEHRIIENSQANERLKANGWLSSRFLMSATCLLGLFGLGQAAHADVRLPAIISTHMMVQANSNPRIWGWASPGEKIQITYANKKIETVADAGGNWHVFLGKIKPGTKFDLDITATNTLSIKDVLAGEVWVCAGQSNMEFQLGRSNNATAELESHNWPQIRFFKVKQEASVTPMNDVSGAWTVYSPQAAKDWSAVGYYFAKDLSQQLGRPVGMIESTRGGTAAQLWVSQDALNREDTVHSVMSMSTTTENSFTTPSGLFNGMINGITPYTVSGITWYQGESNAKEPELYKKLFPALIEDWRKHWDSPELPFIFVQLPNYSLDNPAGTQWAELREAQGFALQLKNTAMAVTIDVGESKNLHPKDKQPIGHRLALNALNLVYHQKLPCSGPTLKSMKPLPGSILCQFDNTYQGMRAKNGAALSGFQICGADRHYVKANAVIQGRSVTLSSPQVANPVAIRYAWANDPEANLENGIGLPAAPFRTDYQPLTRASN